VVREPVAAAKRRSRTMTRGKRIQMSRGWRWSWQRKYLGEHLDGVDDCNAPIFVRVLKSFNNAFQEIILKVKAIYSSELMGELKFSLKNHWPGIFCNILLP
jgi:hypothetical protein